MSGAFVIAIIILVRVVLPRLGYQPKTDFTTPSIRLSPHSILKVASWIVLLVLLLVTPSVLRERDVWDTLRWLLVGVAAACYQVPGILIDTLLVPRGMVRTSYYAARVMGAYWTSESVPEAASCFAVRALLRVKAPDPKLVQFVHNRISKARNERAAGFVAYALFRFQQGDRDAARHVLCLMEHLAWPRIPLGMRHLTKRWLVADAIARGAWKHVTYFADAKRKTIDPWLWKQRDIATASTAASSRVLAQVSSPTAIHTLGALAARGHASELELQDCATRLEAHFAEPAFRATLERRALALGTMTSPDAVIDSVREASVEVLSSLAQASSIALEEGKTELAEQTFAKARAALEDALDTHVQDLNRRVEDKQVEHPHVEAEIAGALLCNYLDVALRTGNEARERVFTSVHYAANHHGVLLDNSHGRLRSRLLAHAIFSWLLQEARALNRTSLIELERKNVRVTY